jgi:DNA damage-inducible protein 1
MRIAITDEIGNIQTLDVDEDMELLNLKALIESELNIPSIQQVIILNGKSLNDNTTTIKGCGIRNDDILLVRLAAPPVVAAEGSLNEAELTRQQIINNPQLRARLTMQQPGLERTLNDSALFNQFFAQMQRMQQQSQQPADPFDIEAQRRIEEEIRNQNILQNRANALEHHPESFARVVMLYISVEVNGHPVKAFVDSGAQMTIMR